MELPLSLCFSAKMVKRIAFSGINVMDFRSLTGKNFNGLIQVLNFGIFRRLIRCLGGSENSIFRLLYSVGIPRSIIDEVSPILIPVLENLRRQNFRKLHPGESLSPSSYGL
ncbi:MAG: hypothetical protein ABGW97_14915 [Christiangramia sp.]|uniref:hypothetical protein n=1 Tax=Christiangramia sp. TaxID=1931228 RepID=UPI0032423276